MNTTTTANATSDMTSKELYSEQWWDTLRMNTQIFHENVLVLSNAVIHNAKDNGVNDDTQNVFNALKPCLAQASRLYDWIKQSSELNREEIVRSEILALSETIDALRVAMNTGGALENVYGLMRLGTYISPSGEEKYNYPEESVKRVRNSLNILDAKMLYIYAAFIMMANDTQYKNLEK